MLVNSDNFCGLNIVEKEEDLLNATCCGEVFIVDGIPFKWWIRCNICKDKFGCLENFLNHATNLHLKKKVNEISEAEAEKFCNENTNTINVEVKDVNTESRRKTQKSYKVDENLMQNIESDTESGREDDKNSLSEFHIETKCINDVELENSNQELEVIVDKIERYQCPHCDKSLLTKAGLLSHIKVHFRQKPSFFKCEECGNFLATEGGLKLHMRVHNGERPEICSICSKAFRTPQALEVHFSIHTGKKRFSCSFCEKKFRIKADLQIHERVHTGEKPAQCDICGGRFRSTSALTFHRKREHDKYYIPQKSNAHNKLVKKKFQCRLCLTILCRSSLKQHKMVHSETKDYLCEICGGYFRTFSGLTSHIIKEHGLGKLSKENYVFLGNNGGYNSLFREVLDVEEIANAKKVKEKQFVCQICGSSYTTNKSLKRHERDHGERKDYKCDICDDTFFRSYADVSYHFKRKHGCLAKANYNYTLIGARRRK